jgi:hypothetical protein
MKGMSMRIALAVIGLSLLASTASAQAPFPGAVQVDGGWVPCDHPIAIAAGRGCGTTPAQTPTPAVDPCDPWPNPYTDRARFLACLATRPEPVAGDDTAPATTYQAGTRYWDGYPSRKMIVLAVALGIDGTPHVLAQWLTDGAQHVAGDTFTFSANEHQPWTEYRGQP